MSTVYTASCKRNLGSDLYLLCISPVVLFFTHLHPVFLPCEASCIDHGLPCFLASYWIWQLVVTFGDGRLGNCIKWFLLVSFPLIVSSISCSFIGCLLYITVSFWVLINVSSYLFGLQDCKSVCVCGECGVCALRTLYKSSLNFPQLSMLSLFC